MPAPKRLVLFVEGKSDPKAAVVLVRRVLTDINAWDCIRLDEEPIPVRVGKA